MACAGKCNLTRYEVDFKVTSSGRKGDCNNIDVTALIFQDIAAAFPDEWVGCNEGCTCLEYPGQNPPPTEWSQEFERNREFTAPGTDCTISYQATCKYRVRLFEGACAKLPPASAER